MDKALLIVLSLHLQMSTMQKINSNITISTEKFCIKKVPVRIWIWSFETINSKFYTEKRLLTQNTNPILEQVKAAE